MTRRPFTLALTTATKAGEVKRHDVEVTQADLAAELSRGVADLKQDPRGPLRTIVSVEKVNFEHPSVTLVSLDCGHVARLNPTMSYKTGNQSRCFTCVTVADQLARLEADDELEDDGGL